MGLSGVEIFTDGTWDRAVLGAPVPVVVAFWAEWCVPSRAAGSAIEAAARGFRGRIRTALVDVDENPGLSARYGIQGLPTLLLLEKGEVVERRVGLMAPESLRRLLARHA